MGEQGTRVGRQNCTVTRGNDELYIATALSSFFSFNANSTGEQQSSIGYRIVLT